VSQGKPPAGLAPQLMPEGSVGVNQAKSREIMFQAQVAACATLRDLNWFSIYQEKSLHCSYVPVQGTVWRGEKSGRFSDPRQLTV